MTATSDPYLRAYLIRLAKENAAVGRAKFRARQEQLQQARDPEPPAAAQVDDVTERLMEWARETVSG